MKTRTIKTGTLYRTAELIRESANKEERTLDLSFSSEEPVERWFGTEVLDHSQQSVRLGRLNSGGPLLLGHNPDMQIGVNEKAEIGTDRKGRAVVRFGKSPLAEEVFQDVIDGIRRNVSVGYGIHEMVLEEEKEGKGFYRATDWEPYEISIVAIPADNSVGVGRSAPERERETKIITKEATMLEEKREEKEIVNVTEVSRKAVEAERNRIADISAIAERHPQLKEEAAKFVREGKTADEFRHVALDRISNAKPVETPPTIGMSDKEKGAYSIVRAIRAVVDGNWSGATLEREASAATAKILKRDPQGFFIPYDIAENRRDLTVGAASAGGYLIGTSMGSLIEMLRNRMLVRQLGATVLGGLIGDVAIPKQSGGATAYWVGENTAPTESQQTLGQEVLKPKTCGAYTDISRKLLMQGSLDVEGFVRSDLAAVLALATDLACINGKGTDGEPTGILKKTGIGDVAGGTNGAAPTYAHMVELETDVAAVNADIGVLAYLSNSKVRGKLKQTQRFSSTDTPVWSDGVEPGFGLINGYRAAVSNQVPSNLDKGTSTGVCSAVIFGNWADLIIGEWGAMDVLVDPYTGSAAGTVRVRVLRDMDVIVRHVESFSAMQDALTT